MNAKGLASAATAGHREALAALFALLALSVLPLPAQTSLSIGHARGFPGATVSVPVSISNATNLAGAQFDVAFDANRVSPAPATPASHVPGLVVRSRVVAPGVARLLLYSLDNAALARVTEATVARLPFVVSPTEYIGSGPLTPTNVILGNASGAQIAPASVNAGAIFISPVTLVSNGQARVFFPSIAGQNYILQATTNFINWVDLSTNSASGDSLDFIDPEAPFYQARFYRTQLSH